MFFFFLLLKNEKVFYKLFLGELFENILKKKKY